MRKETEIPLLSRRKRRGNTQGTAPFSVQKKAAADERAAFINAFFYSAVTDTWMVLVTC